MTSDEHYYQYLNTRSRLGLWYRRWWLYQRLTSRLRGLALDVGCGVGDMLAFRPQTIGVDVNPLLVSHCRALGLDAREMARDVLPFADASFDSAILDNVLEHIAAPQPLLAELRRVLKPDAALLVGVPGTKGWASDDDHKVFYDEAGLRQRLGAAGFECREVFFSPLLRSAWLDRRSRLYCLWGVFARA